MLPYPVDLLLSFVLGIAANLATDWIKAPASNRRQGANRPVIRTAMLMWSLPPTLLPIIVIYLTQSRWVTTVDWTIALILGAFVGAIGLLWVAHRVVLHAAQQQLVAWTLWITALVIPLVILDLLLPRHVALWCPTLPVPATVEITGRSLHSDEVAVRYGLSGNPDYYNHPATTTDDGRWSARLRLTGGSGERWSIWATTAHGRTRECTVMIQ